MYTLSFQIAGVGYRLEDFHAASIKMGDSLDIEPDPTNPHDKNAMKVLRNSIHIGFIPRIHTAVVKTAFDDGLTPYLIVNAVWDKGCCAELVARAVDAVPKPCSNPS